jgi:hypothetical protein
MRTTATIVHRDTRLVGGRDGAVAPVIRYRYTVEGVVYESERITVADGAYPNWTAAQRALGAYSSNTAEVRFNPARPAQAVLSSALPGYMTTVLGVGVTMLLGGIGLVLFGSR